MAAPTCGGECAHSGDRGRGALPSEGGNRADDLGEVMEYESGSEDARLAVPGHEDCDEGDGFGDDAFRDFFRLLWSSQIPATTTYRQAAQLFTSDPVWSSMEDADRREGFAVYINYISARGCERT